MTDWMQASLKWQKSAAGRRKAIYRASVAVVAGEPTRQVAEYADQLAATRRAIWYPIAPVAKPRMTQRDRWQKRPAVVKYREFKDSCRIAHVAVPDVGATVLFCLPIPKSYSKKVRAEYECMRHAQTPDIDNLIKALMDSVKTQDKQVSSIHAYKVWSSNPGFFVIWPKDSK